MLPRRSRPESRNLTRSCTLDRCPSSMLPRSCVTMSVHAVLTVSNYSTSTSEDSMAKKAATKKAAKETKTGVKKAAPKKKSAKK